tara:strand:- start:4989 stop:6995 length:2007 start_codon:yes stop_codon:yes gene_type:complete
MIMVSPFMAFAKGVFQGYNEQRQMERQFDYDMQLRQMDLDAAKEKIKAPAYFQIIGEDQDGKLSTHNLFEMPDKAVYGAENERQREILHRFYNSVTQESLDELKATDEAAYYDLIAKGDILTNLWVKRNTKHSTQPNGKSQYMWGDTFALAENHPLGDRFKKIAIGQMPMSLDRDKVIRTYKAKNGEYYEAINMGEYGPAFQNDKNLLINTVLDIHQDNGNNLGRGVDAIFDDYITKYKPEYFQAYAEASKHFQNVRFSNGALDQGARLGIQDIIMNPKYQMLFQDPDGSFNIENVHKFLRLGSSSVHRVDSGGPYFHTINTADEYIKTVLQWDDGLKSVRARGDATMMALDTMTELEQLYPEALQRMVLGKDGLLYDPDDKTGKKYNPNTEEGKKEIEKQFFTGITANIVTGLVGALSSEGAWGQIESLVSGAGLTFGKNDSRKAGMKQRFIERLTDSAGNISTRKMLQEILIYQVAAALQGGTGGRTISDNDVERISRALGNTLFSTPQMQYTRLATLKRMMLRMYEVNQAYANSTDVQGIKAADMLSKMLLGARLDQMNNRTITNLITTELEKVPVKDAEQIKQERSSEGLKFGNYRITSMSQLVPPGYKITRSGGKDIVTYDQGEELTAIHRTFLGLPIEQQRKTIHGWEVYVGRNPQFTEKRT